MDQKLGELLAKMEGAVRDQAQGGEETYGFETREEDRLNSEDRRRIEQLFTQAREDRAKAYELKRELDRLDVFREYEDRFLDLFKKPE